MNISKMSLLIFISALLTSVSCKKPTVEPFDPPTDPKLTNMAVEWFRLFYADSNGAYFASPYFSGEYVAFCSTDPLGNTNAPGIGVYNRFTGEPH